jgi:hypothetical protein
MRPIDRIVLPMEAFLCSLPAPNRFEPLEGGHTFRPVFDELTTGLASLAADATGSARGRMGQACQYRLFGGVRDEACA